MLVKLIVNMKVVVTVNDVVQQFKLSYFGDKLHVDTVINYVLGNFKCDLVLTIVSAVIPLRGEKIPLYPTVCHEISLKIHPLNY